ncbi:hypothetical protein SAMN03159423_5565 [Bradyrhizobium sp. NFR13]|uniref:hypothetical protein n=1 Tax=Bradyrhizobium sp. NFR13 TaxID=1566285 RepID=UPI0008EA75B9|nr:hypothetical protein [Bradyrhizobium sp. NFR13]SFM13556.1 hypothetical protein SAMN03159423_5565 [Bradyrhizobium sp. NFR13]
MTKTLIIQDIKDFLKRLSITIELDQHRVDGLPPERFSPEYSQRMWHDWRCHHRDFIDKKLLATADAISPAVVNGLTEIALAYEPARVGDVMLELFAEVASGSCSDGELETAEQFFARLIEQTRDAPVSNFRRVGSQAAIMQWLPIVDPLLIARDPECGYRQGVGRGTSCS